jgi:serine/threonine protein kinase
LEDFLLMPRYISTLADLKPLTPERQGLLLAQVTAALQYLHGKGVAHMDVKPDNIAMNQSGEFILIDIGNAAPFGTLTDVTSMFVPGGFDIVHGRLAASSHVDFCQLVMTFLAKLDFKCIQTNGKALHLSPHDALEALRKLECVVCESLSALVCNTAVCER